METFRDFLNWYGKPIIGTQYSNAVLRLIRSAIPVSILYVGKLIIDEVVLLSKGGIADHTYLWKLVAAEFALAIISDALNRATDIS